MEVGKQAVKTGRSGETVLKRKSRQTMSVSSRMAATQSKATKCPIVRDAGYRDSSILGRMRQGHDVLSWAVFRIYHSFS